jgi:hypothetical protein
MTKERAMRARMTCPVCGKRNVRVTIKAGHNLRSVTGTLSVHGGLFNNPATGKAADCGGSNRTIPSRDLPPESTWS